jgi:adenine deaminase
VVEGHVNRAVKEAISHGLSPLTAIQMVTINPAEHFGVARDVGMIAPGRFGDVLIVDDLPNLSVEVVISKGRVIAEGGRLTIELPAYKYPNWVSQSIHLGHPLQVEDFRLSAPADGSYTANVIGIIENQAPTRHLQLKVTASSGEVHMDMKRDIAKVAVVERHKATGGVQVGLVNGFGFDVPCAIATTFAHDSHHMIVVGTNDADMVIAANELAELGGGQMIIRDGKILGQVELPIAGLMSNERAGVVARKVGTVLDGFKACGCRLNNPNMQLSLLALVVIPELRISDLGLVDVNRFKFIPVIEKRDCE